MKNIVRYIIAGILFLLGISLFIFALHLLPLNQAMIISAFIPAVLGSIVLIFVGWCIATGWTWRDVMNFLTNLYP